MFKDGVSVPGLTMKYLFSNLDNETYFSLFDKKNSDLYDLFKDNNTGNDHYLFPAHSLISSLILFYFFVILGGPSIIFTRYHEAGKTTIRQAELSAKGILGKECMGVVGYDANALYLWAMMQPMPTSTFTRRKAEDHFKPVSSRRMADEWLAWVSHERRIPIRHRLNNTEKRIGDRRLPVDGFHGESQTVFQFHGNYYYL